MSNTPNSDSMTSSKTQLSFKQRASLVAGLWLAGLVIGSLMFLITDPADRQYYFLAVAMFPTGLLAGLLPFQDEVLPRYVVWMLWAFYLVSSAYLLSVKRRGVFFYGLGVLAVVVVCNIGGCAYVIRH